MSEQSIFQVIQEQFNIVTVAEQMLNLRLRKCGSTYRADSIAPDGGGKDALAIYEDTNSFYDWKLEQGGDIAQLVADVKFGGNIKEAIRFLMPDFYSNFKTDKERAQFEAKIAQEQKAKRDFARFIDDWHNAILNPNDNYAKLARQYLLDRGFSLDTIKALKIGLRIEE